MGCGKQGAMLQMDCEILDHIQQVLLSPIMGDEGYVLLGMKVSL
jgi:hypothetical protein